MRILLILALLLQASPPVRVYPPEADQDVGSGATPTPPPPPCPCGIPDYVNQSLDSCTGTINPTCNGAPDPFSMNLSCDPGGIDPPGIVVLFISDDGGDQCYGVFAEFLGSGMGYSTYFDTGGYIPMSDAETAACEAIYQRAVDLGECGP